VFRQSDPADTVFYIQKGKIKLTVVSERGTYQRIKETLLGYAAIQVRGGWPTIPADAIAPGASGPEVALLRKRLVICDDLAPELEAGDSYDAAPVDAVKHFQLRHGLEANGSIGPQTLRALNVPVAVQLRSNVCSAWISSLPSAGGREHSGGLR
jgi:murein L,D-transpeptidase YcbB/YkuD